MSINLSVKRQTSEDQTRLILLQISPQETGSAEDLMFLKAVVIRLTAPFEGPTVTATPGARGRGRGALEWQLPIKGSPAFVKWSLIHSCKNRKTRHIFGLSSSRWRRAGIQSPRCFSAEAVCGIRVFKLQSLTFDSFSDSYLFHIPCFLLPDSVRSIPVFRFGALMMAIC